MPIVHFRYKPGNGRALVADELRASLPRIVAAALNIEGRKNLEGGVVSKDISVHVQEGNWRDVYTRDFEIMVFAHDFPERKADLDKRAATIAAGVKEASREIHALLHVPVESSCAVTIVLAPLGYASYD